MDRYFINPNWHVILMHLPLGVLMTGIVLELLSLLWPRYNIRIAARWMIFIGTLGAVITVLAGVYAFRDVVADVPMTPQFKWHGLIEQSTWTATQWEFMEDHITANIVGTGCFATVVLLWLCCKESWQRKLYWPMLIILLVGAVFTVAGAWHGGEAVFRYGTAVFYPQGGTHIVGENTSPQQHGIEYYVPPLQLHVVMAGVVIAMAIISIGLTVRRWRHGDAEAIGSNEIASYAGKAWFAAMAAILITAIAGVWSVLGTLKIVAVANNIKMLRNPDYTRLLIHLIAGLMLAVLAIAMAWLSRKEMRYTKIWSGILSGAALAVTFVIVWLGIVMLYDSHTGPLTKFNAAARSEDNGIHSNIKPPPPIMSVSEQIAGYK